jgi:thiol-disulfide isomerase/thioredoxin
MHMVPGTITHFLKGALNTVYDRGLNLRSLNKFLKDPTAERPWEEEPLAANVLHLDDSSFHQAILQPKTLLFAYAPWCGHCKTLKPIYIELANELKAAGQPNILAAIDATSLDSRQTATYLEVQSYPQLIYFE